LYDWANSAFVTTVATVLVGPYLTALAQGAAGENGTVLSLGPLGSVTAKSLYPQAVSLSTALQLFLLPVLGGVADYTNLKKRLMAAFCAVGSIATFAMFWVEGDRFMLGAALFVVANLCLGGSIVLYNAYLNEITTPDRRDAVSSLGFALGYLGGGILLACNLALITFAPSLGIGKGEAVRLSVASAGVWWGGWSIVTFRLLASRPATRTPEAGRHWLFAGIGQTAASFRQLRRLPETARYLVAYTFYNDGIQTVIAMSSVFLSQELFTPAQREAGEDVAFLTALILMVQFVAFFGATGFAFAARGFGTKAAVMASLTIWCAIVVYAYAYLDNTVQALVMGAAIGVVLGGSQALSRSLYSRVIPRGQEATYFGLYEISERGTSWIGPQVFAVVLATTGSYRDSILSLIVLFGIGTVLLWTTDVARAEREAAAATGV
jgi:UMF1 family MFS transporter